MRIGIDLMGSDRSHQELYEAVLQAAQVYGASAQFLVFATPEAILDCESKGSHKSIRFHRVKEVIFMTDDPVKAVRHKKSSSLVEGMRFLKQKKINALVSTGNTGAIVTSASLTLNKLPDIKRPALIAAIPSDKGYLSVLDVGGSVQLKASLLYQYALLGSKYHQAAFGVESPRIGLLNVGRESKKGTLVHQEAFQLLSSLPDFVGNVEGRQLFDGTVDVLVTDGFTGNVLLKSAEGVSNFIFETLFNKASSDLLPELKQIYSQFNWVDSPGAVLIGVDALVIKCHGSSDAKALFSGIRGALNLLSKSIS